MMEPTVFACSAHFFTWGHNLYAPNSGGIRTGHVPCLCNTVYLISTGLRERLRSTGQAPALSQRCLVGILEIELLHLS